MPSLRDQTFSDPLKDAFQGLVEHASQHNGVHDSDTHSKDFMLLEDVLTETSLLVTTMRNIAELLQDKIVRRYSRRPLAPPPPPPSPAAPSSELSRSAPPGCA